MGNLLASTSGTNVVLVDPWRAVLAHSYSGHLQPVKQIVFTADGRHVLSCGMDGCVYGWKVRELRKKTEGRMNLRIEQ